MSNHHWAPPFGSTVNRQQPRARRRHLAPHLHRRMHRRMHRRCRTCPAVSLVHGYGGSYVGDVPATTNFPVPQVRACARALLLLHAIAGGKPPHPLSPLLALRCVPGRWTGRHCRTLKTAPRVSQVCFLGLCGCDAVQPLQRSSRATAAPSLLHHACRRRHAGHRVAVRPDGDDVVGHRRDVRLRVRHGPGAAGQGVSGGHDSGGIGAVVLLTAWQLAWW